MYKLTCKDMGSADCDFTATGETQEEVMAKMKEHAMSAHPDKMKEMTMTDAEMEEMMKSKMTQE